VTPSNREPALLAGFVGAERRGVPRLSVPTSALVAFGALVLIVGIAAAAPLLPLQSPISQDLAHATEPPVWVAGGSMQHLLGTDFLGRDMLSRVVYGTSVSLLVGVIADIMAAVLGIAIGLVSGYLGGVWDALFMRLGDAQLSIPFLLLAIAVVGALGPSLINVIVVLALTQWVLFARVTRSSVLRLRRSEYIDAAIVGGVTARKIILSHILPNSASALTVMVTIGLGIMILDAASLSFLGLGIQPPTPSLGGMLGDARAYLLNAWWMTAVPGAVLAATILSVNTLGDFLRDRLDVGFEAGWLV
jgi:peptide/nickel transport system permease protein